MQLNVLVDFLEMKKQLTVLFRWRRKWWWWR